MFVGPIRQFDFVREEIAARLCVSEPELGAKGLKPFSRFLVPPVALVNFDIPVVVRIAYITRDAVSRYLLLEVDIRDRRAVVVRVEVLLGGGVAQLDAGSRSEVGDRLGEPVSGWVSVLRRVEEEPVIVVVSVRVERDLLL